MRTTARDQGLRRVSSITRWVAAAAVGAPARPDTLPPAKGFTKVLAS